MEYESINRQGFVEVVCEDIPMGGFMVVVEKDGEQTILCEGFTNDNASTFEALVAKGKAEQMGLIPYLIFNPYERTEDYDC